MINPIDFENTQELPEEFLEEMSNNQGEDEFSEALKNLWDYHTANPSWYAGVFDFDAIQNVIKGDYNQQDMREALKFVRCNTEVGSE